MLRILHHAQTEQTRKPETVEHSPEKTDQSRSFLLSILLYIDY